MPIQIISTKLSVPSLRSRVILRPRLLQKLNQGLECGFVLISAPAGYGKSTLLTTWASRLESPPLWYSLDERDNDPSRFFNYLAAALRPVAPEIDNRLNPIPGLNPSTDIDYLLTALINELSQATKPFRLVLDDYHEIQNQAVHQAVSFLLEHRPAALHLVIATRADPPLPLAKLRARSCLVELRMNDLRFTVEEAADFLSHTMGLKVQPADADHITQRTEGWIAGLQMAALSMQNSDDVSAFIEALSGNQHYIFDYLLEEILAKQPPEIHQFLLHTSILENLSAPLCDALLCGDLHSPQTRPASIILEQLEHANLFIIPLDHEQRWYRYHPLFAELLRGYLQKNHPEMIPDLHTRASTWFEEQGLISNAIQHSFAANDWEGVVKLISANIFALLEQNELNNVARQIETVMKETNRARPWLLIGRAWLVAYTGQLSLVEPILVQAESEIDNLNSEVELQTLGGHIAAIRAYIYWIGDKREIAAKAALAALEWLPENDRLIRCQAATLLGLTLYDFNDREKALVQALGYARETIASHVTIFAQGCWAWLLSMQGKLHEAHSACLEAIESSQSANIHQPLPTLSHVYSALSAVLREWDDLEGALRYAKLAVDLARRWEQADALHFALDTLGYALFASGNFEEAFAISHQARRVAERTSNWFEEITLSQEIEWYLVQNNLDAAVNRLQAAHLDVIGPEILSLDSFKSPLLPFAYIQIFLAKKEYSKALAWIAPLIKQAEQKGIGHYLIRYLILQALAYHGMRQDTQALASLKRALTLAAPGGYVRSFLQEGSKMQALLSQARDTGIMPQYVDSLLANFEHTAKTHPGEGSHQPGLVERLSEREMEVLKLLGQGCTDKKIAESLVIARETVHKHLKNIYGKLDVHSRTEAIARARELSLL